jgi:IMP dehydrogenase|tara:strand:+ start:1251 stop:2705 length:1455 start_codon:yes stop_codon:yes gene_type:complete
MIIDEAYTFDDVLLQPAHSLFGPADACVNTYITKNISLNIPLLSAAMDTVTEHRLAITMAQLGGIGVLHKNFSIKDQSAEVKKVKKFEAGMVVNPVTIKPNQTLGDAFALMEKYKISGIPVVEGNKNKLVGILTNRDVRFASDYNQSVSALMTRNVITVKENVSPEDARRLLHTHRIEKLVVIDDENYCVGLITVKDMEKAQNHPESSKDEQGRLRVAAATGVGKDGIERAEALIDAGVDILVVDTAHGHSQMVLDVVKKISNLSSSINIIGGNVATGDATKALIDSGASGVKVGIGPGSICTTRMIAGVGVPQLSAIIDCAKVAKKESVPIIADGGIKYSGDIAKAIAAGGSAVMVGSLLAGTDETPGEVFLFQGRSYKSYRGMGSLGAMARGSADRYFQAEIETLKLVPEGIEGQVPYKGPSANVIHQLVGGLKSAMGYTGNKNIKKMQSNCVFKKISNAGLRESHVHDVTITREAPNYRPS